MWAYSANHDESSGTVLEGNILFEPLIAWALIHVPEREPWVGEPSTLLEGLTTQARSALFDGGADLTRAKGWPTEARFLPGRLRRIATALRSYGDFPIDVRDDHDPKGKRTTLSVSRVPARLQSPAPPAGVGPKAKDFRGSADVAGERGRPPSRESEGVSGLWDRSAPAKPRPAKRYRPSNPVQP